MADKKTYYYLKLKEGFFDSEDMLLLQGMKDGYIYSDILLKLYLMSLRQDGRLMYTVSIVANYRKKIRDAIRLLKPFTYQRRQ